MVNKLLCYGLAIAFALQTIGQETIHISGKVVDESTNEPLSFSTVSIMGTSEGVVSNFQGVFELTLRKASLQDTLYVSMLGYQPLKVTAADYLKAGSSALKLKESIVILEEVAVTERKLSAKEIVGKVLEKIPKNYPITPYLLSGFTRSHTYECGKYRKLYEADFEVYGGGYHKKTPEKVYINQARQSQKVTYYHSKVLRANSNPFNAMSHINDVLFRSYSLNLKNNSYEIEKYLIDEDELIFVIKTTHSKFVTHTLYIHSADYALLKVIMEMDTPEGEDWNPFLNKGSSSDSLDFQVTRIKKAVQFEKKEMRYYTKYMDWLIAGTLTFQESGETFGDWGFRFETMFNEVITENPTKPSKEKLFNFRAQKAPKSTPYIDAFWESYTPIEDFPASPEIVKDLQVNGSLDSQFKKTAEQQ